MMVRKSKYAKTNASERRSADRTAKLRRRVGAPKLEITHVRFLTLEQLEHVKQAALAIDPPESLSYFGATACLERADRILGHSVESGQPEAVPA